MAATLIIILTLTVGSWNRRASWRVQSLPSNDTNFPTDCMVYGNTVVESGWVFKFKLGLKPYEKIA